MGKRKFNSLDCNPKKIPKLTSFGITTSKSIVQEPVTETVEKVNISEPDTNTKKGKFLQSWKFNRSWLSYDSEKHLMFCTICIRAQVVNVFTTGCGMMKKESVAKHENRKGDNSYKRAIDIISCSNSMIESRKKALSKSKSAVIGALRNVYFAAINNLSNVTVPDLNDLCIQQGASQLKDLKVDQHTSYSHNQSVQEFQQAIAEVLETDMLDKVKSSGLFSIMIDESTDISVHQNMVIYIRYLEEALGRVVPKTSFLGISQLSVANADCIVVELMKVLNDKGLNVQDLAGMSTDGASVMVGSKKGVVTQVKVLNPSVLSTHCIAHRLALSCGGAADKIPYLVQFQKVLNSVYKYFHNSPKNQARLESIQAVLQVHSTKFKEVFHTRWLSFEGAVHTVVLNYQALLSVFLEESSGKALSLFKPLATFKFLYCCHFLSDVLKQLCILCKLFQKTDLDFSEVNPMLHSTVLTLQRLKDGKSGLVLKGFLDVIPSEPVVDFSGLTTFEFGGHTIKDSVKQRQEAVSACQQFVSSVIVNLQDRFCDTGDAKVMTALTGIFDSTMIASEVGVSPDDMETITSYLQSVSDKQSDLGNEVIGFHEYIRGISCSRSVSKVRDVAQVAIRQINSYPVVGMLAKRLLVLPVSTVDCERGFSKQNLIKTDLRNSLKIKSLENLMWISIEGPPSSTDFNFEEAFDVLASKKPRRILQ